MSSKRIVKENKRYYPERYEKPYFFGLLGGYWKRYKTDELVLNGSFTTLEAFDLSYSNLEDAKGFFNKEEKIIFYKDDWDLNNNL